MQTKGGGVLWLVLRLGKKRKKMGKRAAAGLRFGRAPSSFVFFCRVSNNGLFSEGFSLFLLPL